MEPELDLQTEDTAPEAEQSNSIPEDGGMNPDDAAAAMGFATTLSQQLLPQEEEQGNEEVSAEDSQLQTEEAKDTPTEETPEEAEEDPKIKQLEDRITTLEQKKEPEDNSMDEIKDAVKELGATFEKKRKEDKEAIIKEIKKIIND